MPDQPTTVATPYRRDWWPAAAVLSAIVLFRAGVFVFWERAQFDSDQAIFGLMAKHLSELRALPVFMYGQNYILGVEAWMAAPLFAVVGPSVTALKVPLLVINIATAVVLLHVFTRDVKLRPWVALFPVLFFALPAAGTAARLVDAGGGNVEPFLYVVLIWLLRDRPVWCGVILGFGFLQREFTVYGFVALLALDLIRGDLYSRDGVLARLQSIAVAGVVWIGVQGLKLLSSGAGPGTTIADVHGPSSNFGELAARSCFDPGTLSAGARLITLEHWPTLFGTASFRLSDFGIVSTLTQGAGWSALLLAALVVLPAIAVGVRIATARRLAEEFDFCLFLSFLGLLSVAGYIVGRCGAIDFYFLRYELLSILAVAGIAAAFLAIEPARWLRRMWLTLAVAWFAFTAIPHVRLWHEYIVNPPADVRRELIAHLDSRGIRYAASTYWISYAITFLTDERIIMKSEDFVRIREYERLVDGQRQPVWRVARKPCGEEIMPRIWLCRD
jgi:hypothetical protein